MNNAFGPKKPMVVGLQFTASGCGKTSAGSDGPADQGKVVPRQDGNAKSGQEVFRHETFGNEGFWTGAARAPQGMTAAHATPMQVMQLGLSINVDALDESTKKDLAADLKKIQPDAPQHYSMTRARNALEGLIAVIVGGFAGSISLVGFGIDSFIEVTSGSVLLWRMSVDADVERRERNERSAAKDSGKYVSSRRSD